MNSHRVTASSDRPPAFESDRVEPLHVLDITDFYSDTASGGVKTYLRNKAEHLAARGIRHTIVVPGSTSTEETMGPSRIVKIQGPVVPVSKAYRVMFDSKAIGRVLEEVAPDVIEIGSPFLVPYLVKRVLPEPRPALVGFYHADIVRTFAEPYVPHRAAAPIRILARMAARRLIRRVYSRFDATVAASTSVVEELRSLGVPRVFECSLGVDLETFRPRPAAERVEWAAHGVPTDRPIGIYAGRFCAEKRLDVVLEGHAATPERDRPHLVLVGDGPHREQLEERAANDPFLTLLPYQSSREALARMYASADFYIACGPGETFGLSIAEGMASGLPLLVVDRAAAPDRLGKTTAGEKYHHGSPESATDAIVRLVQRLRDGEPLGEAARRHAESAYDWNATFDRLVELYRSVSPRHAPDGSLVG